MRPINRLASAGAIALLTGILVPAPSHAQDAPPLSGSVSIVSDYRYRGVSYSDLDPAVQAGLTLTTRPGFFANVWGTNIANVDGANVEIDLTAGWSGVLAGLDTSGGVIVYTYPGSTDTTEVELFATAGMPVGPATATFGLFWAPNQKSLPSSNRYAYAELSYAIPGKPVTLKASLGNERGGLVPDETGSRTHKWDWLVGADVQWKALTLGVAWVGNDLPRETVGGVRHNRAARDTVLVSLSASF